MRHSIKILTIAATLLFASTAVAGNTHDPGVNKRQRHQQKRIAQGIKSGSLTPREVVKLEKEQVRIAREERRFKSDGVLTKRERAKLHHDLNHTSRHIYKEKRDRQHRR